MPVELSITQVAKDIRRIYEADQSQAETLIEGYLEKRLNGLTASERSRMLGKLSREFDWQCTPKDGDFQKEILSQLFSLLLGRKIPQTDLLSTELLQRLAESLNIVFDTLNQLVSSINKAFYGEHAGEETIRRLIGFQLEGGRQDKSLEAYLSQISKVFLIAQEAFKRAFSNKVNEILSELDPLQVSAAIGGSLKFGPLRRAELFDIYEERYFKCKNCFESGRFMEEFLREFERACQELSV